MNKKYDLVIVGAGMVGLSLAAALKNTQLKVAVLDLQDKKELGPEAETRVSAINLASQLFLDNLGAWQGILAQRTAAYTEMQVADKDSFGEIAFSAADVHQPHLGHIIENTAIRNALWDIVESQDNVDLLVPEKIQQVMLGDAENFIILEGGKSLSCTWLVAADGANSMLRDKAEIPLTFWDYDHTALVATVKTELEHQHTARQMFLPEGPLAFLPLYESNLSSIVWSMPNQRAEYLSGCEQSEFNKELASAFGVQLGLCELVSERQIIPLRMRFARDFVKDKLILIGDAAHTIHPLAGQGVNLGLMDAAALAQTFIDSGTDVNLREFERWRKAQASDMIFAMEGFKRLFAGNNPLKKLIRGAGLKLVDNLPLLKQQFSEQALGIKGNLPKLAKIKG